ncbi:MAG: tetratricopeptide repeat protein [Magnetococcus sp. XQGC-1]
MAYDLEEQEQLATLKAVWKQYGNLVTWIVIIALVGYAAWSQWNNYQNNQAGQASQLYEELLKSVSDKDASKILRTTTDLKEKFPSTAYAPMGAFVTAKAFFDSGDLKSAKSQLQWIIDSGKSDEYKALAKLRLAGLLLDDKSYDDALKQLTGEFPAELQVQVEDRKGDVYVALGKVTEARKSYQAAIDKMTDKDPIKQLVQLKLDAIGGGIEPASK